MNDDFEWLGSEKYLRHSNGELELVARYCPYCDEYFNFSLAKLSVDEKAEAITDAEEHVIYCNPAHKRAMAGESF